MSKKKTPPGPFFSTLGEVIDDRLAYYVELMEEYGDIVKLPLLTRTYLVNNTEMIKYFLKDNADNYLREGIGTHSLRLLFGNGLLLLTGAAWKKRRIALSPQFHSKNLPQLAPPIQNITRQLLNKWATQVNSNKSFDISEDILGNVYLIALKVFFDQEVDAAVLKKIMWSIVTQNQFSVGLTAFVPWLPTIGRYKFNRADKILRQHINQVIQIGKNHPNHTLLNTILNTTSIDNQPLNAKDIYDEVKTFLMTGHETTGSAIVWTIYLLAQHPEIQNKLKQELSVVLGGRDPEFSDMQNLPYTRAVIEETLRLYPPIWSILRTCQQDDKVGDYFIPKGSMISISPYILHRRKLYWSNPYDFMPERHLQSSEQKPPQFAFIPFGVGPHLCIASHFAMFECMMIVAMIQQHFTVILDETHVVEPQRMVSLKPRNGVKIFLKN